MYCNDLMMLLRRAQCLQMDVCLAVMIVGIAHWCGHDRAGRSTVATRLW